MVRLAKRGLRRRQLTPHFRAREWVCSLESEALQIPGSKVGPLPKSFFCWYFPYIRFRAPSTKKLWAEEPRPGLLTAWFYFVGPDPKTLKTLWKGKNTQHLMFSDVDLLILRFHVAVAEQCTNGHTHTQFNMDLQRSKGGLITFSTSSIHIGAYILRGNIEEPQIGLACNRERRNFARLSSKALFFLTFQTVAYENAVVHKNQSIIFGMSKIRDYFCFPNKQQPICHVWNQLSYHTN